jgi:hypothetical protein
MLVGYVVKLGAIVILYAYMYLENQKRDREAIENLELDDDAVENGMLVSIALVGVGCWRLC